MSAPAQICDLVERFAEHVEGYRNGHYNETQLRRDYLDGFLRALGWDVDNSQGFAEAYREVVHEDAVRIGEHLKSPDYSCRVGGVRKFFVEAEKPSVDIKQDPAAAYHLRRYAWSAKLPLSILTNFAELSVYDCRIRPMRDDKASTARLRYWTYTDADKVNAFDWTREFPAILARGGFDAVVGNPPYISALALTKLLDPGVKDYWKANFCTAKGTYDIYVLFFEKALALTRVGGYVAFITPNKYLSAPYGQALREAILTAHNFERIADYSAVPVFEEASVYPVISISRPHAPFGVQIRVPLAKGQTSETGQDQVIAALDLRRFPENIWGTVLGAHTHLCSRIYSRCIPLETVATVQATSTAAEADEYSAFVKEGGVSTTRKMLVNTGTIDRYKPLWGASHLVNKGVRFDKPTLDIRKVKESRAMPYATP
jgi:hypothetical protein